MNEYSRLNLQRGIPENKAYKHTDYTPESEYDKFFLQMYHSRQKAKELMEKRRQQEQQKELEKLEDKIAEDLVAKIEKELEKAFK